MSIESTKINKERYEKLTLIPFDRPVDPFWTKKYRLDIEHNGGKIPQRTEWCITINEKDQILNGKNRRAAVMQYNELHPKTPIKEMSCFIEPYYVGEDANLKRAQELNNKNTRWKDDHYIGSFAMRGDSSYIKLQNILKLAGAKKCARKIIYQICSDLDDEMIHSKLIKGDFVFSRDEDDAKELIAYVADCKDKLKKFGHTSISIPVFIRAMLIKNIDRNHLANRVKNPGNLKVTLSDTLEGIMKNFNKVYNGRLTANDSPEPLNLVEGWKTVAAYNQIQKANQRKEPKKRKRTDIPVVVRTIIVPDNTPEPLSKITTIPEPPKNVSKIIAEHKKARDIISVTKKKIVTQVTIPAVWMDYDLGKYGPAV